MAIVYDGDPFRDAFRAKLQSIVDLPANNITWPVPVFDTWNTDAQPDASEGYFTLEFNAAMEEQATFGAPGDNLYLEIGQVTVRVNTPLAQDRVYRNKAERYALIVRNQFRNWSTLLGFREIRVEATSALGDGFDEGGMWSEAVALGYRRYNVG